jgi:threonine/homoserine/homoserine lactone efflux protein
MFYLAFFPQFDLGIGPVAGPAVLAAVFWGLALLWYVGLIAAVGRVEAWLARRPVRRTMAGVTGTALTGAGLALAVRG